MKTIHVIGDSISIRYGPYLERYISPFLDYSRKGEKIGKIVNPEGDNGGDSSQMLMYIDRCIHQDAHWDMVIINCGLHDVRAFDRSRYQVSVADYERNLNAIFDAASNITDRIVWVRTTPVIDERHNSLQDEFKRYNADIESYNAIADRIVADRQIWSIDLYTFTRSLGGAEIYADHVHFTPEISNLQGAFIAGHVLGLFGSPNS